MRRPRRAANLHAVSARKDDAAEFFEGLAQRGHDPTMARATSSVRIELVGKDHRTERWLITADRGNLSVSRGNAPADCTVRVDRELFGRIATGEANAFAAMLRGAMTVEGEYGKLLLFQRLFRVGEGAMQ